MQTKNFTFFNAHATIFGQFTAGFHFSNYIGEIDHFTLDLLKVMETGPTELIYPYKRSTIKDQKSNYGIPLDLWKRSSKIRKNYLSDPQLNMI